jgi:tetratricopeptide (TPR) repeat protein
LDVAATLTATSRIYAALLLAAVFFSRLALADGAHPASCDSESQSEEVTRARAELNSGPNSLEAQLKLADALIDRGCYKDAVPVLEAGLTQRPRSSELQSRLRAARSMLNEEHFFEGLGNARETAKYQHDQLRCSKLADVSACDDALRSRPNDPQLTVAKGDALLHGGRAADAMLVYRHAQELQPADEGVKTKLAEADSQRQALVSQCEGHADAAAVDACQAALLHGTPDEFVLLKRKGILLQSMARSDPALDAFIAADVIKQDDPSVALAIVALTDSTGRQDALALAARGSALLTLGRPTESLKALQQAQTLAPALPGIKAQLARAEHAAQSEARRKARVASAKPDETSASGGAGASAKAAGTTPAGKAAAGVAAKAAAAAGAYSNDANAGQTN